jgi:spore coat polysaccharide biosynthesis protein SpsF
MASTRLPGKVLLKISPNKTVLDLLIERIMFSEKVDRVVVATTNKENDLAIVNYCISSGYEVFKGNENDCLDRHYKCALSIGANSISKIPSDVPFIDPVLIDKNISLFETGEFDFVSTLHPPIFPDGMDIETMTFDALQNAWKNADMSFEREHTTPYIWDNPDLFKIGAIKSNQNIDYFMNYRFTIDYQKDLEFMRKVYKNFISKNIYFTWQELVKFLDNNPSIKNINQEYFGNNWYGKHINQLKTFDPLKTKNINE